MQKPKTNIKMYLKAPLEGFVGLYEPPCTQKPHGHFEKLAGMWLLTLVQCLIVVVQENSYQLIISGISTHKTFIKQYC